MRYGYERGSPSARSAQGPIDARGLPAEVARNVAPHAVGEPRGHVASALGVLRDERDDRVGALAGEDVRADAAPAAFTSARS